MFRKGVEEEDFLCTGVNTAFTTDVEAIKVMDFLGSWVF